MDEGLIDLTELRRNLEVAASVLEAVYVDESRRLLDTEDELSELQAESVPSEVRYWLASTFSRKLGASRRRPEEKPRNKNPYHNLTHAADVLQTAHYLMLHTGIMHWLSELEILAMVFAAAIHDFEHTGTTNNFHIQTRSEVAILYNDRSVLENHHVSAAYRLMVDDDMNIFTNLNKEDWRELRALVIEMVMSTDMSCHFQQIKTIRNHLPQSHEMDKVKVLSLMLHAADISHPAKTWSLHHAWTHNLMEEFFRQGDKEMQLGLRFSPLCDRKATMIGQSRLEAARSPWSRSSGNSSGRHGNGEDGQTDFSLAAVDLRHCGGDCLASSAATRSAGRSCPPKKLQKRNQMVLHAEENPATLQRSPRAALMDDTSPTRMQQLPRWRTPRGTVRSNLSKHP
ncbi:hypothetical protein CRUP_033895 [Coryphaenoides rupestris]|nr:hypothetical protein CRUP_033895 [Coryphaenoides rupestris]